MPRKKDTATTATAWLGAPPVAADGFAFANGDFFAEASGQNRHRRATLGELKEHFSSGSDKDHPAHWFEAQLIHYGLKPSKTKSVARMRLHDAVNAGELTVPTNLASLERNLRKEWTKNDREIKKGPKTATASETKKNTTTATTQKDTGTKRKANDNTNAASTSGASTLRGTKKTKTATFKDNPSPKASSSAKPFTGGGVISTASASTPRRGGISRGSMRGASRTASSLRSRAVRRGGVSQGSSRGALAAVYSSASISRPIQTARRSAPLAVRGRIQAPQTRAPHHDDYNNTFGNYIRYDDDDCDNDDDDDCDNDDDDDCDNDDDDDCDNDDDDRDNDDPPPSSSESEHDEDTYGENVTLAPLSCINGRYAITSSCAAENWPQYGSDFVWVFTISGSSIWATFDLGLVQGVIYFPDSPRQSSYDPVPFKWRGRETEGPIMYGDRNEGWIKFLGDGRIEGQLRYHRISFRGRRRPGPATVGALTMQNRWKGYSEEEYERENLARWH